MVQDNSNEILKNGYSYFQQALKENKDNPGPVLFEMAKFLFQHGMYEEALKLFIRCHRLKYCTEEIQNIVLEAYYEPNVEEFKSRYENNIKLLSSYQYIKQKDYPKFSELRYCFVPYSDEKFIIFDKKNGEFAADFGLVNTEYNLDTLKPQDVLIIENEFTLDTIINCEIRTRDPEPYLWAKLPLYLYYRDFTEFIQYLQVIDFSELLKTERLVFLYGDKELKDWFAHPQSITPTCVFCTRGTEKSLSKKISELDQKRNNDALAAIKGMHEYYNQFSKKEILKNIEGGKPRILFVTTRFSTAIQHFTRDCVLACETLGIPNRLLIEADDVHRGTGIDLMLMIDEFKPDILFTIDHFRWERPWVPDNLAYICWIQDPLAHIMSQESARKTTNMDFLMNLFFSSNEFSALGYPQKQLIDAPIPANQNIYKTYELTEQENREYKADICVFSNAGDPGKALAELLPSFKEHEHYDSITQALTNVYNEAYQAAYNEKPLYSTEQYKSLILKWFNDFGLTISETSEALDKLTLKFRNEIGFRILRSVPLEWLHQKGYEMKLWGKEWVEHPILSKYAKGVAANGKTLSKIINASKIVLGTNSGISTHPRVFETILSNCFYLGVNIPEEYDWGNIRRFMEEGKEIVFFYSKADLYKKVDYYLENENQRRKIIENGKKKILAELTYETLMKRVLEEIAVKIEKQIAQ